jgi:hypothetical protein
MPNLKGTVLNTLSGTRVIAGTYPRRPIAMKTVSNIMRIMIVNKNFFLLPIKSRNLNKVVSMNTDDLF